MFFLRMGGLFRLTCLPYLPAATSLARTEGVTEVEVKVNNADEFEWLLDSRVLIFSAIIIRGRPDIENTEIFIQTLPWLARIQKSS